MKTVSLVNSFFRATFCCLLASTFSAWSASCCFGAETDTIKTSQPGVFLKISQIASFLTPSDNISLIRGALRTENAQLNVTNGGRAVKIDDIIGPIANVGDWIFLEHGDYTISFNGPAGYGLSMGLEVTEKGIFTTGLEADGMTDCYSDRHVFVKRWAPSIRPTGSGNNKFELLIASPSIVRYKNRERPCYAASIWEPQKTVSVSISSEPSGAEILVNGKNIGKTNAKVNIPCRGDEAVDAVVVLRKTGYANCVKKVTNETGDKLSCKLMRP